MMRWPGYLLIGLLAATGTMSCHKRPAEPSPDDAQREKELELFETAIRAVQDRYVDVERVQLDQLISNSLKGMVESIDPYATIYYSNTNVTEKIPADATMLEISGVDEHGIAILRVYGFNASLKKQIRRMERDVHDLNPAGILLDCRGAGGDDYTAATALAEWFLPRESIVGTLVEEQGKDSERQVTKHQPMWSTNHLAILVDRRLSGPAEFLAAALQHYKRGILVGETSRGVAVIQSTVRLTDEWNVRLSTGRVLDPAGRDITGNPLVPDVAARPEPDEDENVDWILRGGAKALREQLNIADQPR